MTWQCPCGWKWKPTARRPPSAPPTGARLPGDDPAGMAAGIAAYREAGAQHIVLALNTGDAGRIRELMQAIAAEVLPQFR